MSKKEINKNRDLSIAEQFQAIIPSIDKRQEELELEKRVWKIYSSMGDFSRSYAEDLWPEAERLAFIDKLLEGDSDTLNKLEELEKSGLISFNKDCNCLDL